MKPEERERFPEYARYWDLVTNDDTAAENLAIGDFLEWIRSERSPYTLCMNHRIDGFAPAYSTIEELLCEYHGIDYRVAQQQRERFVREAIEAIAALTNNTQKEQTS